MEQPAIRSRSESGERRGDGGSHGERSMLNRETVTMSPRLAPSPEHRHRLS
jgi:hypothetical protein